VGVARRAVTTALVVAAAPGAIAACGPSGSRYLAERDERVYLRIPRDWKEIETSDSGDPLVQQTADAAIVSKQIVSPEDGVGEIGDLSGEEPVARMTVYEISGSLNQRMSTQLARVAGSGLAFDPALPSSEYEGLTEVLNYDPDPSGGERSGSRLVYRVRPSRDEEWAFTFDLTTYFDPVAERLYVLEIGCTTACFDAAAEQIDRVARSWEVDR
jgi:hypothetical protein